MSQPNLRQIRSNSHRLNTIQDYISDKENDNSNNNYNNMSLNNNNNQNTNSITYLHGNPQLSPKNNNHNNNSYNNERLPEIQQTREYDQQNDNSIDRIRQRQQHQRSSNSLYRHINYNNQQNMFNPYITNNNYNVRSYSQKVIPQAVVLQQTRQERIVIQEQNQMLINRLRKLRFEEIQLQKSAEDATKKAEKLFQNKKSHIRKKEEEQLRQQQQDDVGYTHPKKQLEMLRVQIAREEKLKEKIQGFYSVKKKIAEEQIRKAQEEKIQLENIRFKMEQRKKQKEISKLRKDQYILEKKQRIEKDIEKQRIKEEALLSYAKYEAKDFEKREQEMLERIRQTQILKDQAKEQLKDSIQLDTTTYENRYSIQQQPQFNKKSLLQNGNNHHNISSISTIHPQLQQQQSSFINTAYPSKLSFQKGIGSQFNSQSISQQTLQINPNNGQSYISNQL